MNPDAADLAAERMARMRQRLGEALAPTVLEVEDESHLHAGHPGARDGRGHFALRIASARFVNVPMLRRHRLIYAALGSMMNTDIHALKIDAFAPDERKG